MSDELWAIYGPDRAGIVVRFMKKVNQSAGCWEWFGSKKQGGYGRVSVRGKLEQAHRVAYVLFIGPIQGNSYILHKCDNSSCVNPPPFIRRGSQAKHERYGRPRAYRFW